MPFCFAVVEVVNAEAILRLFNSASDENAQIRDVLTEV